jgi:hypothetical protein
MQFDAAQCGYLKFNATQCGCVKYNAVQFKYTHLRSAYSGYKKKLSQCLLYMKSKFLLLGKEQKITFGKFMQSLTINNKINYFIFLSDNMALYFIDDDFVKKILRIAFILQKSLYYRHDFVALLNKLHKKLKIFNFTIIFIICLQLYTNFFSKYYACQTFLTCQYLIFKNIDQYYTSKFDHYSTSLIGGGAHDSNFIPSELYPYNDALRNMIGIFKFHIYVTDSMKLAILGNNSNLYECKIPLNILICKLKLSELKLIASAHQIKFGSKVKVNELQNLILEHKCHSCVYYTSIFEFKNQSQNQKVANLKASKKYQNKHAEKYKLSNLNSVKKHQQEHAEEYKFSHLNSVKKYQQEHAEEYKLSNLKLVKKYQQEHPDEYKHSHLNSVKKHQQEHADEYKFSHLSSVKKHQQEHAEEYKLNNLKLVKKYQQEHPDEYKHSNLNSVKKHQQEHVDEYKFSHLNSVKKHQQEHAEEYKLNNLKSVKKYQQEHPEDYRKRNLESVKKYQNKVQFPPEVLSKNLQYKIITDFVNDMSPTEFEESGCAVCGKLTLIKDLQKLSKVDLNMEILKQKGVSQKERKSSNDKLEDLDGPIIEDDLDNICNLCYTSVLKKKLPQMALANGKWLGKIPTQLQDLSYAEQLLIARIRHNRCLVQVSSGMRKMTANAISFANPIPKVYKTLPPPIEEMDNVLAFIYTGPCQPTKADFERTPLLVRHKKVSEALEWLKLNHIDYFDIEISYDNLKAYPEDAPPVLVDYRSSTSKLDFSAKRYPAVVLSLICS